MELQEDGIRLPAATWLRLQSALLYARNRLRKNDDTDNLCENVSNFIQKIQHESIKFRSVIELASKLDADLLNLRIVTTFSTLTDTPVPNLPALKKCLGLWNSVWLQNDMRNFLYLLRSNGLLLNNRLNVFDPTVSPNCSFCRIIDRNAVPRDGFLHLCYECPITNRLLQQWCRLFEPQLQVNDPSFRKFYWYGISVTDEYGSAPQILVADTFKYVLWKYKQLKKIPNFPSFIEEIFFVIWTAANMSAKIKFVITNNNMITNFLQARG